MMQYGSLTAGRRTCNIWNYRQWNSTYILGHILKKSIFTGHCVVAVCESSCQMGRNAVGPVVPLLRGADAPENEMTTDVVAALLSGEGEKSFVWWQTLETKLSIDASTFLFCDLALFNCRLIPLLLITTFPFSYLDICWKCLKVCSFIIIDIYTIDCWKSDKIDSKRSLDCGNNI